ncbi:MAG: CDP-alcohol phosphatidyltransferase family protein [Candidatus Njordarchaeia archaeon]
METTNNGRVSTGLSLIEAAFKTKTGDGIFSLFIYRPVVYILLKKKIIKKSVNPNKVTLISFVFRILAFYSLICFLINFPMLQEWLELRVLNISLWIWVFFISYNISFLLDCLDGAIARFYGTTSLKGQLFDSFVDNYGNFIIMIGLMLRFNSIILHVALIYVGYNTFTRIVQAYGLVRQERNEGQRKLTKPRVEFKIFNIPFRVRFFTADYFIMTNNALVSLCIIPSLNWLIAFITAYWVTIPVVYYALRAKGL